MEYELNMHFEITHSLNKQSRTNEVIKMTAYQNKIILTYPSGYKLTGKPLLPSKSLGTIYELDAFAGGDLTIDAKNNVIINIYGSGVPIISTSYGLIRKVNK